MVQPLVFISHSVENGNLALQMHIFVYICPFREVYTSHIWDATVLATVNLKLSDFPFFFPTSPPPPCEMYITRIRSGLHEKTQVCEMFHGNLSRVLVPLELVFLRKWQLRAHLQASVCFGY